MFIKNNISFEIIFLLLINSFSFLEPVFEESQVLLVLCFPELFSSGQSKVPQSSFSWYPKELNPAKLAFWSVKWRMLAQNAWPQPVCRYRICRAISLLLRTRNGTTRESPLFQQEGDFWQRICTMRLKYDRRYHPLLCIDFSIMSKIT